MTEQVLSPAPVRRQGPAASLAAGADPLLHVFLVLLVLTQRLGIPLGTQSIAVSLPLSYGFILVLLLRRRLSVSRLRTELFIFAVAAVLAATAVVGVRGGTVASTSLMLLLATYLPWLLHLRDATPEAARSLGRTFVRLMAVLSAVGVGQLTLQLTGAWTYQDYLRDLVGASWLTGDYNFSTTLVYASPIYKANAFVMLEPSFLSQFCALAVLVAIMLRARAWILLLLISGLASAVSGTGILLLIAGVILLVVRAPQRIRPGLIAAGVLAVAVVSVTPVATLLLDRSSETSRQGSSGYLRFVQPYQETITGLQSDSSRWLFGAGPGATERLLTSYRGGLTGEAVTYTIVPKLLFEYGLLAGGLLTVFLLVCLLDRAPWRVVPGSLVVMTFFLSGALLQPQTAFLAWLLTGIWTANPTVRTHTVMGSEPRARRRSRRRPVEGSDTIGADHPL